MGPPPGYSPSGMPPPPGAPPQQQQQQQQGRSAASSSPTKPLHQRERIDPSQMPNVRPFLRGSSQSAPIYHPRSAVSADPSGSGAGGPASPSAPDSSVAPPPPADSRYLVRDDGNASPRLMRATTFHFPRDRGVNEDVGVPLGLVCAPLWNGPAGFVCRSGGGSNDDDEAAGAADAGGHLNGSAENGAGSAGAAGATHGEDPEAVPVIRSQNGGGPVTPVRCTRCSSYLNPFATVSNHNAHTIEFECNFCSRSNFVQLTADPNDPQYSPEVTSLATMCGTVEYEVGGEYITREREKYELADGADLGGELHGVVEGSVHLYAIDCGDEEKLGVYLNALEYMARDVHAHCLRQPDQNGDGGGGKGPNVGLILFRANKIAVPYLRHKRHVGLADRINPSHRDGVGEAATPLRSSLHEEEEEAAVALMTDVTLDPFCPLPLGEFTFDLSAPLGLARLRRVLGEAPGLVNDVLADDMKKTHGISGSKLSCAGAALAVLGDALSQSNGIGRGTLLTSRRPNYGVGALRDRELSAPTPAAGAKMGARSAAGTGGTDNKYARWDLERELYTPLQDIVGKEIKFAVGADQKTGKFYKDLGDRCVRDGTSLDVFMSTPLVEPPNAATAQTAQFLDLATLGELCRLSCGSLRWVRYDPTDMDEFSSGLREELARNMCSHAGYDALFKVRCSAGVRVKALTSPHVGPGRVLADESALGILDDEPSFELTYVSPHTTVALAIEHKVGGIPAEKDSWGRKIPGDPMCYFQSALLYTASDGRRRVRVSTLGLRTTTLASDAFRSSDFGTTASVLTRRAVAALRNPPNNDVIIAGGPLKDARNDSFRKCVDILANYRIYTSAKNSPLGQLILPETLQLLPLFCLSLRKSRMLSECLPKGVISSATPSPNADDRASALFDGGNASPSSAMLDVHPNMFRLTPTEDGDERKRWGEWIAPNVDSRHFQDDAVALAANGPVARLPPLLQPSVACLDDDGMYLLDSGSNLFLYVGNAVPRSVQEELLEWRKREDGTPLGSSKFVLSSTSDLGRRTRNVAEQLRRYVAPSAAASSCARRTYLPLVIVTPAGDSSTRSGMGVGAGRVGAGGRGGGKALDDVFLALMIDDATTHERGYTDFLVTVHRQVKENAEKASSLPWDE